MPNSKQTWQSEYKWSAGVQHTALKDPRKSLNATDKLTEGSHVRLPYQGMQCPTKLSTV